MPVFVGFVRFSVKLFTFLSKKWKFFLQLIDIIGIFFFLTENFGVLWQYFVHSHFQILFASRTTAVFVTMANKLIPICTHSACAHLYNIYYDCFAFSEHMRKIWEDVWNQNSLLKYDGTEYTSCNSCLRCSIPGRRQLTHLYTTSLPHRNLSGNLCFALNVLAALFLLCANADSFNCNLSPLRDV